MKRIVVGLFMALLCTTAVHAQSKSIVGKWKVASINVEGMNLDLEKPESIRQTIADQMSKAGQTPDSATLNMMFTRLTSTFEGMQLEFTSNGKAIYVMPDGQGSLKSDTAAYSIDNTLAEVNTVSKEDGVEKKETMSFKFEGDYLVLTKKEKEGETIRLKRIK